MRKEMLLRKEIMYLALMQKLHFNAFFFKAFAFLTAAFFMLKTPVNAQLSGDTPAYGTVVTFAPIGVLNKARVKIETSLGETASAGAFLSAYYGLFPGIQVAPIARLYTSEKFDGFYLQAKGVVGYHSISYDYLNVNGDILSGSQFFSAYGGGFAFGVQQLVGNQKNISIDFSLGAKLMTGIPSINNPDDFSSFEEDLNTAIWYITGPGSYFDANLGIGFAF